MPLSTVFYNATTRITEHINKNVSTINAIVIFSAGQHHRVEWNTVIAENVNTCAEITSSITAIINGFKLPAAAASHI